MATIALKRTGQKVCAIISKISDTTNLRSIDALSRVSETVLQTAFMLIYCDVRQAGPLEGIFPIPRLSLSTS